MTNPAILEALARAIHCHDGRLPTPWDDDMIARWPDDCEYERKVAMSQAAAVLELVGPRKLEWAKEANSPYHKSGRYTVYQTGSVLGAPTNWRVDFGNSIRRWEPTLEAAQAAAQAHADAAHWANTKIGGE